jgi:hypothetical protein
LTQHCTYNKNKVAYMERTAAADLDRLDELLDVAALVEGVEAEHQAKAGALPELAPVQRGTTGSLWFQAGQV